MKIARLQVDGGFLTGLDMQFADGLNVIAGARGTGKTSVIELMRYALGLRAYNEELHNRATDHALSVLGDGQVVLTLNVGGVDISFNRTAVDDAPRHDSSADAHPRPLLLSQTEVEHIGLDARSRLRLIDGFSGDRARSGTDIERAGARVTLGAKAFLSILPLIDELAARCQELSGAPTGLADAEREELALQTEQAAIKSQQERLTGLSQSIAADKVRVEAYDRDLATLNEWLVQAETVEQFIDVLPSLDATDESLAKTAAYVRSARSHVGSALRALRRASDGLGQTRRELYASTVAAERDALEMRRRLEELQTGAGDLARRAAHLREKTAQYQDTLAQLEQLEKRKTSCRKDLDEALDQLDEVRATRYGTRRAVAAELTKELSPDIEVSVQRDGLWQPYANALAGSLRGSNVQYRELSHLLAQRLSPRELVEAVVDANSDTLADVAAISMERASKIVTHLRSKGVSEILGADLQDDVAIRLLDGEDYKPTTKLSTGQRCTAVLPILLARKDIPLIVDQPEDHLDNGFIATTVVTALVDRSASQTIIASHNANIPVLGGAQRLFHMAADGARGFVWDWGDLRVESIRDAVIRLMEGGADAFKRRADFYSDPDLSP